MLELGGGRQRALLFARDEAHDRHRPANDCDGTMSRIDPATNTVVDTIELGHQPKWLAVGDGRVWVGVSGTRYRELGCDGEVRG